MSHCPIRDDECVGGYKTEAERRYGETRAGCAWWDYKEGKCLITIVLEKILSALAEQGKEDE